MSTATKLKSDVVSEDSGQLPRISHFQDEETKKLEMMAVPKQLEVPEGKELKKDVSEQSIPDEASIPSQGKPAVPA